MPNRANREDQKPFVVWNALSISIRYIASIISLATFCCSIIFAVGFPNIATIKPLESLLISIGQTVLCCSTFVPSIWVAAVTDDLVTDDPIR